MLDRNEAIMAGKSDEAVAWIATALSQQDAGYAGDCPCPTNTDANGNQCGARSGWSKEHASRFWCYAYEVPAYKLPIARDVSAHRALPVECGGIGATSLLDF
jgi:hypothetical protein